MATIKIKRDKFFLINGEEAPNTMTLARLMAELKNIKYAEHYASIGGTNARHDWVENGPLPPFVTVFYALFTRNGHIPRPEDVCRIYHNIYCVDIGGGFSRLKGMDYEFYRNDLYGRITRAYCSWCRELSLLYGLFAMAPKDVQVYYDLNEDLNGIDIVLKTRVQRYNIHSCLGSYGSQHYRKEKQTRHAENGIHLNVVATHENTILAGDIQIHEPAEALALLKRIHELEA